MGNEAIYIIYCILHNFAQAWRLAHRPSPRPTTPVTTTMTTI